MIKKLSKILLLVVCFVSLITLVSCGISQSYADKINAAAESGEHITFDEIEKKLGDPTIDVRILGNGLCTWVSGVSKDKFAELLKEDSETISKKLNGKDSIVITFLNGKATNAVYSKYEYKK